MPNLEDLDPAGLADSVDVHPVRHATRTEIEKFLSATISMRLSLDKALATESLPGPRGGIGNDIPARIWNALPGTSREISQRSDVTIGRVRRYLRAFGKTGLVRKRPHGRNTIVYELSLKALRKS